MVKSKGFTLVELLIVIVVIAILAAITITAYNGVQDRANDTAIKSDLSSFAKQMEIAKINHGGTYPAGTGSDPITPAMGFHFTKDSYQENPYQGKNKTLAYCYNSSTDQYILYAYSKSDNYFKYISGEGISSADQTAGWGICNQIGLDRTNPSTYGLDNGTWADWTNMSS